MRNLTYIVAILTGTFLGVVSRNGLSGTSVAARVARPVRLDGPAAVDRPKARPTAPDTVVAPASSDPVAELEQARRRVAELERQLDEARQTVKRLEAAQVRAAVREATPPTKPAPPAPPPPVVKEEPESEPIMVGPDGVIYRRERSSD